MQKRKNKKTPEKTLARFDSLELKLSCIIIFNIVILVFNFCILANLTTVG